MAHIKLFESWLSDIADKVKSAFTGDAGEIETPTQSDSEFKSEFEKLDASILYTIESINPFSLLLLK